MSDDERRERYAAAIRNIRRYRDGKNLERQAEAVMALADAEIESDRTDAARERWITQQLDATHLKAAEFRDGATIELEPARDIVAHWVGAARGMLGDAPNYSETRVSMEVGLEGGPEQYAFVLQRLAPGALTPHEARQQAEARAGAAEAELREQLVHLWYDLATAQRMAYRNNWSIGCDNIAGRIQRITRLVGPTHWRNVAPAIFDAGNDVYARLHAEIDVDIDPADIEAAREYRAAQVREAKEAIGGDQ